MPMAHIKPFCAVRPNATIASEFSSASIQFYSEEKLNNVLKNNPFSFIQILKSNLKKIDKNTLDKRYENVKKKYQNFKDKGYLTQDSNPAFYIYEIDDNENSYCGIIAAASVEDYKNNIIKKHENTIETREERFKNYLKAVRFNAEPVLLTYKNSTEISNIIDKLKQHKPTVEFSIESNEKHRLWKIDNQKKIIQIQEEFKKIAGVYIADGHHRSASSVLLSDESKKNKNSSESIDYFMVFLIPENDLKIQQYNRVVTDLNGYSKTEFLEVLKSQFDLKLQKNGKATKRKHSFTMYLKGQFYCVSLQKSFTFKNAPLYHLDTYILQELILKPILGVTNVRNNKRLDYSYENDDMQWIKKNVDNSKYAVGFGLNPIKIDQLKSIANAQLVMPPKSTYIYPKLRSGITIYEL
jgi:uncharacterized protein (DUF1015 family)